MKERDLKMAGTILKGLFNFRLLLTFKLLQASSYFNQSNAFRIFTW